MKLFRTHISTHVQQETFDISWFSYVLPPPIYGPVCLNIKQYSYKVLPLTSWTEAAGASGTFRSFQRALGLHLSQRLRP